MNSARRRRIIQFGIPCAVAVIQVVGTLAMAHWRGLDLPAVTVPFLLAGPAALLFMRRRPALVLTFQVLLAGCYVLLSLPWGPVFVAFAVALFNAALRGRRWQSWAVVGLVGLLAVLQETGWVPLRGAAWTPPWAAGAPWAATPALAAATAWLAVLVLLGEAGRRRRSRLTELREQRAAREQAERDEYRLALARDIHDVVGHSLSLINVQASVALHLGEKDPARLTEALRNIKDASKDSLAEVRDLLDVLREQAPADDGIHSAPAAPRTPPVRHRTLAEVEALVEEARAVGVRVELEPSDGLKTWQAETSPLTPATADALFRAVQEGLSNVRRHAAAPEAMLACGSSGAELWFRLSSPAGEPATVVHEGHGLVGMRERVAACGGSMSARAEDGRFLLEVSVPRRVDEPSNSAEGSAGTPGIEVAP
ncbi:sensor histidine kinase [Arthrobacter sp. RCC_34]|uniref:sensor histidine kinase n=1 Tax=Arthrobacter sp. RCC_34 TaxID=3239230 RepID=UPI0035231197